MYAGRRQAGQAEPRVFFATERTLPASVRTTRTIIALGCIMARFGLFLNFMAAVPDVQEAAAPPLCFQRAWHHILVCAGSPIVLVAFYNYLFYVLALPPGDIPRLAIPWLTALLCLTVAMVDILLGGYLILT